MSSPPGNSPIPSTTARLAAKEAPESQMDAALVRRSVDALVTLSRTTVRPMRRKEARAVVLGYHSPELDGWSHWLTNTVGVRDPTGESAVRALLSQVD